MFHILNHIVCQLHAVSFLPIVSSIVSFWIHFVQSKSSATVRQSANIKQPSEPFQVAVRDEDDEEFTALWVVAPDILPDFHNYQLPSHPKTAAQPV